MYKNSIRFIAFITCAASSVSSMNLNVLAAESEGPVERDVIEGSCTWEEDVVCEDDRESSEMTATDRVICYAENRQEAEEIAKRYGYLLDYGYHVATIGLDGLTVDEAVGLSDGMLEPDVEFMLDYEEADGIPSSDSDVPIGSSWQTAYWENGFNDPALNPENEHFQWMHEEVNSYAAWGVTTGDPGIVVAVLDTGVYSSHEDLPRVTVHDIGYGAMTSSQHGTHVAGIIAAAAGNGKGGAGIAPGVSILGINVFYNDKHCARKDVAKAIYYVAGCDEEGNRVADRRADVINMSLGGIGGTSEVYQQAIDAAYRAGVTVVAAMGNDYSNARSYPAAADHVIAVCATDQAADKTLFSNYGPWADVSAPGHDIYSTGYVSGSPSNDQYAVLSGTSMASPVVAGACALYMSAKGHVDPDEMETVIKRSVHKSGSRQVGTGIIDLAVMFGGDATAPELEIKDDAVVISASPDSTIVYSTDGKAPSVKNGMITHGIIYENALPLTELGKQVSKHARMQIKAMAVTGMGVASRPGTLVVEVDPNAGDGSLESIILSGPDYVVAGSPAKYKVTGTIPASIAPGSYDWSVTDGAGVIVPGAEVSTSGVLKVTGNIAPGTKLVVRAGSDGACGEAEVTVREKAVSVIVTSGTADDVYGIVSKKGTITSLRLFTANVDDGKDVDEHSVIVSGTGLSRDGTDTGSAATWSTSNAKIVDVIADGNTARLLATGKGTATVKCTVQGKSTAVKVKVEVPVSDVCVTTTGSSRLAYGGKTSFKASVGKTYGIPSNPKVRWEYDYVVQLEGMRNGTYQTEIVELGDINSYVKKKKLIKFSGGKLSIAKQAGFGDILYPWTYPIRETDYGFEWADRYAAVRIRAISTDGTEKTGQSVVYLFDPVSSIALYDYNTVDEEVSHDGDMITITTYEGYFDDPMTSLTVSELSSFLLFSGTTYYSMYSRRYVRSAPWPPETDFTVVSSNPNIASGAFVWSELNEDYPDYSRYIPILVVDPVKKGTVTLTISPTDGSGFKRKVKVTVR